MTGEQHATHQNFMPLQHQRRSPVLIPELHTTTLRTRDNPLAIMRDGNREHIILVASEIDRPFAEPAHRLYGNC